MVSPPREHKITRRGRLCGIYEIIAPCDCASLKILACQCKNGFTGQICFQVVKVQKHCFESCFSGLRHRKWCKQGYGGGQKLFAELFAYSHGGGPNANKIGDKLADKLKKVLEVDKGKRINTFNRSQPKFDPPAESLTINKSKTTSVCLSTTIY